MKLFKYLPFILFFSCIDMITQTTIYNSLYFEGGAYIEIDTIDNMKLDSNDFTLQFWVSGSDVHADEMEEALDDYSRIFSGLGWNEDQLRDAFCNNARRLFSGDDR